jgi:hypothetical protein
VAGPLRATPPPLPRRPTTLDARAAFDVDLEPPFGTAVAPTDPFAPLPPEAPVEASSSADPFGPPPSMPALAPDPFDGSTAAGPPSDPFGGPQFPPAPLGEGPGAPAPSAFDPFTGPAPAGQPDGLGASPAVAAGAGGFGSLALEELTTPPARRVPRSGPLEPAPMPVMAASEDPFGAAGGFAPGLSALDDDVLATAVPGSATEARIPPPPADAGSEPPLQLDPFGAAAVASDPLAVGEPPKPVEPPRPVETTDERKVTDRAFRIRDVLVSAMALAALLLLSLAILVVWRGGLAPGDALRPATVLSVLAHRPPAGVLTTRGVTSGRYERAHGAPLLFVRGTVVSTADAPVERVRVIVEVVRDGAVLLRGEVPAGAVPGPEALHAAVDGPALARALAEAASPEGARLDPGGSAPFLVAFADYPADLGGASLRIRTVADR